MCDFLSTRYIVIIKLTYKELRLRYCTSWWHQHGAGGNWVVWDYMGGGIQHSNQYSRGPIEIGNDDAEELRVDVVEELQVNVAELM